MRNKPWETRKKLPWMEIKEQWEQAWDMHASLRTGSGRAFKRVGALVRDSG